MFNYKVGEWYETVYGDKFECIFVEGGKAWMRNDDTLAYTWDENGKSISLNDSYNLKPQRPKWMDGFSPEETDLWAAFTWTDTTEGFGYWAQQKHYPTTEGLTRWLEMHAEYARAHPRE